MQPKPEPNNTQPIHEQVIEDIKLRAEAGKQNYGTYLQVNNGRDSLLDAYEEAQDLALYLKQAILERDAKANADAIALAVRALEACAWNVTNHPDGEQQQFQQCAYLAKQALAALKGDGK